MSAIKLYLIRHGPTEWNAEKRIQGQIDNPLSAAGVESVKIKRLPPSLRILTWYCSPLMRARQTAGLLGLSNVIIEPAFTEMHWGEWEGQILKPLRKKLGNSMRDNEARGIDFRPPGGESPRDVQQRVANWTQTIASRGNNLGVVAHKGIIRCIYAMAMGWDMRGEPPVAFDWHCAHEFSLNDEGAFTAHYRSVELVQ